MNTENAYFRNASLIKELLTELMYDEESNLELDIDKFLKYIFSSIYFVVIETVAGLSKTLQIFDAINTTGLDLNGGDVFKIRMYEYLRDIKKHDDDVFEKISELYAKIDRFNQKKSLKISILEVLRIYQFILISKYKLPANLNLLATDTFFDRLFDTIFNINEWPNFTGASRVDISLEEIEKIIDIRFKWEELEKPSVEDVCAVNFIQWSRYGRYMNLIFIYMFNFEGENDYENKLFEFIRQLNKLYIIYSVRYQKAISEIHTFSYTLVDAMCNKDSREAIELINRKISSASSNEDFNNSWNYFMSTNLTYSKKRKDLVCRLSAMLDEDYSNTGSQEKEAVQEKLFFSKIDIEHIQSYNDENLEERELIKEKWEDMLNSLGNLVVLESDINRSIHNINYELKKEGYEQSSYQIVRNHVSNYSIWNLEEAKKRQEYEMEKINKYIFE